jgi:molecular chaperone GrpE
MEKDENSEKGPEQESVETEKVSGKQDEHEKLTSQFELLMKELQDERRRTSELSNRMKYLQADIVNLQKQSDRMLAESRNQVRLSWILEIISIKEDLERALKAVSAVDNQSLVDGLNLVKSRIDNTLKSEDVETIKVEIGGRFDPRVHEAITYQEKDDADQGEILSIVSPGYSAGGRVIKPTLVEVARKRAAQKAEASTEFGDEARGAQSKVEMQQAPSSNKNQNEL